MVVSQLAVDFSSNRVAIAVSGGGDSMALLLLAREWARKHQAHITALTVDHGLRPESAAEALQVADWCTQLGIDHHILRIQDSGLKIQGKQEEARNARYQMLIRWCKENSFGVLATAHHRGDQAETLFFRLGRGSGLLGLSCMASSSDFDEITLLRPLLDTPKSALIAYLQSQNQSWIEDPSNQNPRYTRSLLRKHLHACEDYNAIEERAAKLATFFGKMRAFVEQEVALAIAHCVTLDGQGAKLHFQRFNDLADETAKLMLGKLIVTLNGNDHPPRRIKLEHLATQLQKNDFSTAQLAELSFDRITINMIQITREDLKNTAKVPYSKA